MWIEIQPELYLIFDLKPNLFTLILSTLLLYILRKECVKSKSCNAMELCLMECIFVISHEYSQKTANKRKLWNGQSSFFFSEYPKIGLVLYNLTFSQNSLKKAIKSAFNGVHLCHLT